MTERYDQETILGYVEGELSDDQRAGFEAVLADDHELRQLVSQMKLDRQALRGLGTTRAPVGLIDQVIQSHERSALLGDPEAPEPLPMTMPTSRWTFRRTLAYGSVAAVLILSFGLVFQTLIPPGLINHGTHVAQNSSDATGTPVPDVGDGVALLDEDSVYDKANARALGRRLAKESGESIETPPAAGALKSGATDERADAADKANNLGQLVAGRRLDTKRESEEALAGRVADAKDTLARTSPEAPGFTEPAESLVAAESSSDSPVAMEEAVTADALAFADTASRDDMADGSVLPRQSKPEAKLAETEVANESDADRFKGRVLADAFAGYGHNLGEVPTQLVVNSSSPTQARRDIRDWALANSARVVEPQRVVASVADSRRGGIGGAFNSLAGSPGRKPAAPDSGRPADAERTIYERALHRQPAEDTQADGYYVLIDQDQVPSLLSYLNRSQGQRAELIATTPEAVSAGTGYAAADDRAGNEFFESRHDPAPGPLADATADTPADEAEDVEEKDEAPKAVANRLVDTESGWFQRKPDSSIESHRKSPIVRGLAGTPGESPPRRREVQLQTAEQEAQPEAATTDPDERDNHASTDTEEARARPAKQPTYFDWNRLLEPRKESAPLVSSPAPGESGDAIDADVSPDATPDPAGDSRTNTKLRIQVIIQQAADEAGTDAGSTETLENESAR